VTVHLIRHEVAANRLTRKLSALSPQLVTVTLESGMGYRPSLLGSLVNDGRRRL
jgi:hypothetical protein